MAYGLRVVLVWAFLAVVAGCGLLTGREEPDHYWDWAYLGEMRALANGEPWEARVHAVHWDGASAFALNGFIFDLPGLRQDPGRSLGLGPLPMEPSRIKLDLYRYPHRVEMGLPMPYYVTWLYHDLPADSYYLLDEYDNWVEIEWFDAESRWVAGRFQLSVAVDPEKPKLYAMDPDTIHFTEGRFRTYVWDYEDYDTRRREFDCRHYGRCP